MRKKNRPTFSEMTISWLNSKPALAEASQMAYKGEINRLAEHFTHVGVRDISAVSREAWWSYLASIEEKRRFVVTKRCEELRAGSIQQARRITRDFFMWARELDMIDWFPRLPERNLETRQPQPPKDLVYIDPAVTSILTGEIQPKDLNECRAHMVFNLIFWGAMKPAVLAMLRVCDIFNKTPFVIYDLSSRRHIELPKHVGDLWRSYCHARREISGASPKKGAPLISHLEDELPLSAWGVWLVFKEWHKKHSTPGCRRMTPRDLRAIYLDLLCRDGEFKVQLACAHGGLTERRVQAWSSDIPAGIMASMNGLIRADLKAQWG